MLKAYKYRLYPTVEQQQKIDASIGVCRLVYNLGLEVKLRAFSEHGVKLSSIDLCYQLVDLKKAFPWIEEVDSQALQASVKKIDKAFNNFFRGAGYPKFKSKKKGTHSFQCPNNTRKIDWINSTLTIPKIKNIPIVLSRKFAGTIKTVTISKTSTGKYYTSILVDNKESLPAKSIINPESTIGIDVGLKSLVVTSDGRTFEPSKRLKNNLARLKVLARRASRKKKGSNNRKKANKCLATLHERITNQRLDYIHKVTTQLIHDNQVESFVIEDLNVSGLLKNRKLSQAFLDAAIGNLFRILKYKCDWYGKNLIVIGRFDPSSKRCNNCGHIYQELALSEREWTCNNCKSTHDRDLNAAKNIKHFCLEQTTFKNNTGAGSSGEPVEQPSQEGAMKQENVPFIKHGI
jgi:putative transposase